MPGVTPGVLQNMGKFSNRKKIINIKIRENISLPEARNRFASFPLGRYADTARRRAQRRLVSFGTQYCKTDYDWPQPLAELTLAVQPVTAPPAESAAVAVATSTVGSDAAPSVSATLTPPVHLRAQSRWTRRGGRSGSHPRPPPVPPVAPRGGGPSKGPPDRGLTPRSPVLR